MAEGSRGRMPPWLAFFMGALIVLVAVGAYIVWRNAPAAPDEVGLDIEPPAAPSLPPITPAPEPAPVPLPIPGPAPG